MKIHLEWQKSALLSASKDPMYIYSIDESKISEETGIYIFGREHGDKFEALYVGRAKNIKSRIVQHLKNLPLMSHLRDSKSGKRILLTGIFKPKQGQNSQKCVSLAEKAFIQHFLLEGHNIANIKGKTLNEHHIISEGYKIGKYNPEVMYLPR
ncbi:hypothetical protein [Ferrovibrio sp.]|uniref:hypothetical protein n=1 Tax=Ferrovibrio sp. TaxID=1917215 RepID=UPI001B656042|nr:hypothetical protein [Ferrovibrio sp.]MBP7066175.1 GIY-YIG nuclease family protein [Ferrovibrio sp.]